MTAYAFPATISARDIQRGYKKIFDTVKKTKKPIIVMANNNPQAAIVSMELLEKFREMEEDQKLWLLVDQIRARNADKDPDEIMRDVTAEVAAVRQKMYEKRQVKSGR